MVKEIVALRNSGILLFHYSVSGSRKLDELTTAFLSAVGSFTQEVNQSKITVMSFAQNKLVWERKGDLYFIALVSENDSGEIHRVILQDLAEQFVSMYYEELRQENPELVKFRPFADVVEATLHKFNGIPGLARRYQTILLPTEEINRIKRSLAEVEVNRDILRGALITIDGYVASSNLRAYELEAFIDFLPTLGRDSQMFAHTSLDKGTSLFIKQIDDRCACAFVVKSGRAEKTYLDLVLPFITLVQLTSFDESRKFEPEKMEGPISFYDFDAIKPIKPIDEIRQEIKVLYVKTHESLMAGALRVINALEKRTTTVYDSHEISELQRDEFDELLANLIAKGFVQITRIYPILEDRDERFTAFLEVIGIKKRDFDVVNSIWKYCNGALSIKEIAEKSEIPAARILEVLNKLGNHVSWQTERRLTHVR